MKKDKFSGVFGQYKQKFVLIKSDHNGIEMKVVHSHSTITEIKSDHNGIEIKTATELNRLTGIKSDHNGIEIRCYRSQQYN